MLSKKTSLFLIILCIFFICVGCSSASQDSNVTDMLNQEDNILIQNQDLDLSPATGNYSGIQDSINRANENEIIIINGTYKANSSDKTIIVGKKLTFQGINNATIDGSSYIPLFQVNAKGVIFKDIIFKNAKTDGYGGAVTGVNCNYVGCTFINNSAFGGGAVEGMGANISDCKFIGNNAVTGGAVYSLNSIIVNCVFINNTASRAAGAVCLGNVRNSFFINNSAQSGGSCQVVTVSNCTFINNSADNGGAMEAGSASDSRFINNKAIQNGGAMTSTSSFNCEFINNSAAYGGAMNLGSSEKSYFINNHANHGGAIYKTSSLNCTFINNTASFGGAIRESGSTKSRFINNSAADGGAIWGGDATDCQFIKNHGNTGGAIKYGSAYNCIFINNTATAGGGAFFHDSNTKQALNCIFINNSAPEGGSMYRGQSIDCIFTGNSATKGGAKYFGESINCNFTNNSAEEGGAMYMGNAQYSIFINNSATNGGAVYGRKNMNYFPPNYLYSSIKNSTFIANSASNCGGAIYFANVENSSFINNSAPNGGAVNSASCKNCNFTNNSANYGGAILIDENLRTIDILNSIFTSNKADGGEGYAVYLKSKGNVCDCTFIDCTQNSIAVSDELQEYKISNCNFDVEPVNVDYQCDTTLEVNNLTLHYGEGGILTANLSSFSNPLFNKLISFDVNGNKHIRTTNHNGQAFFNIADYIDKSGKYTITVSFEGDEHYSSSHVNSTININKYSVNIGANNLSIIQGEFGLLAVNISSENGSISNKRVGLTINSNKIYKTTNSEGMIYVNVNEYFSDLGKYEVKIDFEGDEFYESCQANITVAINKYRASLSVRHVGKYYSDTYLIFKLMDINDNSPISNSLIKVAFSNNQTKDTITDSNGVATCQIPLNPGIYNVTAEVIDANAEVNPIEIKNLQILNIIGQINLTQEQDNHRNLIITLADLNGELYKNIKVILEFDNGRYAEVLTNEEGLAYYKMNFNPGNYSVLVHVSGDFNEVPTEVFDIEIRPKEDSKICFADNITFGYERIGQVNFTVVGGILSLGDVYVLNHPEAIISVSGNILAVYGLAVGNYTLFAKTTPDEYHNSVNTTLNVEVNRVESRATFSGEISFEYGGYDSSYVAVIGGIVEMQNIKVLNHPEAVIKFENNKITVSGLNPGNYRLCVETTPDENHKKSSSEVKITVKKAKAIIKASKITVALKKSTIWKIKVTNPKSNQAVKNARIDLKVFSGKKYKIYHITTDSNGIAGFKTSKLTKGKHKVVISGHSDNYDFNKLTSSINVIKQKKLTFKAKVINGKDGSTISITVKQGKKAINGVKVKLVIFTGKKYVNKLFKTKKKGKYNGVIGYGTNKLSVGKHKIIIKPVSIKFKGLLKTSMVIKKSAKKSNPWETIISAKL